MKGVYEKPPGSGVWWINYYINGSRRREKVGTEGAAKKLYMKRKTDGFAADKLPERKPPKKATVADLIDLALAFAVDHASYPDYITRGNFFREMAGIQIAEEWKPAEIAKLLNSHCTTPATYNRYKAFVSLCYREGMANQIVLANPAKLMRQKPEPKNRLRFLSREEYEKLYNVIQEKYPEHLTEFVMSVKTGMRLTEQYTIDWDQVNFDLRTIKLDKAKNGDGRAVRMQVETCELMREMKKTSDPKNNRVFRRDRRKDSKAGRHRFDNRYWFDESLKTAGIKDYTWHTNRHTFCSWLAMEGASQREIMDLAGHKTITMAARYSHLSPQHALSVLDRI